MMTDWIKAIQSQGRGFRPGVEVKVIDNGGWGGKTFIMDYESDTFRDWQHVICPHYVEMWDSPGKLSWFRYDRKPSMSVIYEANRIVRHNEDGSFEYIKNRDGTGVKVFDETETKEFLFTILSAKRMT